MSVAWPWCFLLLPLPWLLRRLWRPSEPGLALRVPAMPRAAQAATRVTRTNGLAMLVWFLLLTAAARPQIALEDAPPMAFGRDLMLAVDVSASMAAADLELDGQAVQRLAAAKLLAGNFLQGRRGDRVGLVVFGRQAYLHTPLTFDLQAVQDALAGIETGLAGNETALGDAIALSVKQLHALPDTARVLVLLTDGANTAGTLAPQRAAWLAAREGVRVHALGIGSSAAGALDEETLRAVAMQTGGSFMHASDSAGIMQFFRQLDQAEPIERAQAGTRALRELYPWPLGVAVLLLFGLLLVRLYRRSAWA